MNKKNFAATILWPPAAFALLVSPSVFAQSLPFFPNVTPNDAIEQRQEQRNEADKQRVTARPDVLSPAASGPTAGPLILPPESPCFPIKVVVWDDAQAFGWLTRESEILVGQCAGTKGLQAIRDYFATRLVTEGFVTTRVLIPGQNLSSGTLRLQVVAGRIDQVKSEGAAGWWRTALPTGPEGLVNQRDLDQGMENVRRLQGQADATIDLVPGDEPGEADLVVKPGTGKRWPGLVTADNGRLANTGQFQMG